MLRHQNQTPGRSGLWNGVEGEMWMTLGLETEWEKFQMSTAFRVIAHGLSQVYSGSQEQRVQKDLETSSLGAHIYLSLQAKQMQMKQV